MRYLGNLTNAVRTALLTATNIVPSTAIYRTDTAPKVGGGDVLLSGPYTGARDTQIEIEILGTSGSAAQASAPIFDGVGNGTISGVTMTGLDPQTFSITLEDLGTQTLRAYANFQGLTLRARETGADGNVIVLTVDGSGLEYTPTAYALQSDLQSGTNEYRGGQWNFGAVSLTPEGFIPADAPRITIGNDPQIYRQFRKYVDGQYVYSFSPAPVRDIQKGARVRAVTGDRTITISNGVDTDTLAGVVTLYDALTAIRDQSALVLVDGPIRGDRTPGGQAVVELSVPSESYAASVIGVGSVYAERADIGLIVAPDAPSETLAIQCVENLLTGHESWTVRGDISDRLPNAETGVPYAAGPYEFTIPSPEIPSSVVGALDIEFRPVSRGEGEVMPAFRAERPILGASPINGTYTFVLAPRPPEACDPDDADFVGLPREECLGVDPGLFTDIGGNTVSESIRLVRFQKITRAVREWMQTNTSAKNLATANSPYTIPNDVKFVNRVSNIYKTALDKLATGGILDWGPWVASTPVAQDLIREPVARNGYRYAATTPGTTGASEPNWSTALTLDSTVSDGTVVWTNIGKRPLTMYDEALTAFIAEITDTVAGGIIGEPIAGPYGPQWGSINLIVTDIMGSPGYVRPSQGSAADGYIYMLMSGSVMVGGFGTEPTWGTTVGGLQTVVTEDSVGTDYTAVVQCINRYWAPSSPVTAGLTMETGNGWIMVCTQSGTTGSTMPTWPMGTAAAEITDGTAKWNFKRGESTSPNPGNNVLQTIDATFYERYVSRMTEVLAAAGIDANFDGSSGGDGCWTDLGMEMWWVEVEGRHLPIFTNNYYHATTSVLRDGVYVSVATREWGFGPRFGCPESLKPGDTLIIKVAGSTGANGYQQGDQFAASIVLAEPLPFGGGQTGNDMQTWSVRTDNGDPSRLPNYMLNLLSPAPYSQSGLTFLINPGGIPFAAGDEFRIAAENGQFRWRRDGGSWAGPIDIAPAVLADGLTAGFIGGKAPSWVEGDRWTFKAEAVNGVDGLRSLTDPRCAWAGSTTITITPDDGATNGVFLAGHTIPSTATITLQGSNDSFATTPLNQSVAWAAGNLWVPLVADFAAYRLLVNASGSAQWLYLGATTQATIRTGRFELGRLQKRWRLPSQSARRALGVSIEHTALTQDSVDALLDLISFACENDDRLLAVVPNDAEPGQSAVVRCDADTIEVDDELSFQPRDTDNRLQKISLELQAA